MSFIANPLHNDVPYNCRGYKPDGWRGIHGTFYKDRIEHLQRMGCKFYYISPKNQIEGTRATNRTIREARERMPLYAQQYLSDLGVTYDDLKKFKKCRIEKKSMKTKKIGTRKQLIDCLLRHNYLIQAAAVKAGAAIPFEVNGKKVVIIWKDNEHEVMSVFSKGEELGFINAIKLYGQHIKARRVDVFTPESDNNLFNGQATGNGQK